MVRQLENTPIGNYVASWGSEGLSRQGREIGEAFVREYKNSNLDDILDGYIDIKGRLWSKSETVGQGFVRAVGYWMAQKVSGI